MATSDELHAVSPVEVGLAGQASVDGARRLFEVRWQPRRDTLLAEGPVAAQAMALAFDRGALGVSAQLLGVAARVIELTVEYRELNHLELTVAGYDDDPRSLYEVPEVNRWMRLACKRWPDALFWMTLQFDSTVAASPFSAMTMLVVRCARLGRGDPGFEIASA